VGQAPNGSSGNRLPRSEIHSVMNLSNEAVRLCDDHGAGLLLLDSSRLQLAFLRHPLVTFGRAFDPILKFAVSFGHPLRNLIHAGSARQMSSTEVHKLASLEFVFGHGGLQSRWPCMAS
jgi:hypothetical protein